MLNMQLMTYLFQSRALLPRHAERERSADSVQGGLECQRPSVSLIDNHDLCLCHLGSSRDRQALRQIDSCPGPGSAFSVVRGQGVPEYRINQRGHELTLKVHSAWNANFVLCPRSLPYRLSCTMHFCALSGCPDNHFRSRLWATRSDSSASSTDTPIHLSTETGRTSETRSTIARCGHQE